MDVNPQAAGFDPSRLERITDHLMKRYIESEKIAGCQALVARGGHVAYFRSLGLMDRERNKPMADDTIFRIYSMTKPIASVALMTLYEQGHFQLADPVHRFIPEWRDLKVSEPVADGSRRLVEPQRPMTVRDLLMHMSGLERPRWYGARAGGEREERPGGRGGFETIADLVPYLAERPLVFHPGTHWMYGLSTDIVGLLVERISGERFDRYLQQTIFEPLKMADTGFGVPEGSVDRFAANYGRRGGTKELTLVDDPAESAYTRPRTYFSGAGGLVSTTADYLRFARMLLNGGQLDGTRILGPRTIDFMARNHLPGGSDLAVLAVGGFGETTFEGVGFGLGFAVTLGQVDTQTIGSTGDYYWGGAASTIFWCDPVEDLTVIFMTQFMPSGTFNFRGQLRTLVYPAIVD